MSKFKYVGTILLIIILLVLSSCMPQDANNLGDMYVNNIYPNPTNTYSLGSSTYQWNVGYFKSIYLNGSLLTPNGGGGVPSGGTAGQILTKIDSTDYNTQWVTFFGVNEDSNSNTSAGQAALYSNTTGNNNSAFGQAALANNTTGSNNLGLGFYAGFYNTTVSNQLFINTLDQGNHTNDVSNSLIYGIFNATPSNQVLSLNAGTINMDYLPTSNPHVVGKLWNNSGTLMVSGG
jgi:hypothetical protein